jgi:hypothetical protein
MDLVIFWAEAVQSPRMHLLRVLDTRCTLRRLISRSLSLSSGSSLLVLLRLDATFSLSHTLLGIDSISYRELF